MRLKVNHLSIINREVLIEILHSSLSSLQHCQDKETGSVNIVINYCMDILLLYLVSVISTYIIKCLSPIKSCISSVERQKSLTARHFYIQ